jgi:hypothetical protein
MVDFSANPISNPISRLPITFTSNVPTGIEKNEVERFSLEIKYLATLPINPPDPISKICFSMLIFFKKQI